MNGIGKAGSAGLLACGIFCNGAVAADPATPGGIAVQVTPLRQSLAGNDDVPVTVTIANTSALPHYLLAWQTPFAGVAAPLFDVTRDGMPVRYTGMLAKRPAPGPADYIVLAPGQSRSVQVELSRLYRMDVTGAYSVRYRSDRVQVFDQPGVPAAQARAPLPADPAAAAIWIGARLPRGAAAAFPAAPAGGAGLGYRNCSNAQQDTVAGAVQAAQAMAEDGSAYLQGRALQARYSGWFGAVEAQRAATAVSHFGAIRAAFATQPVTVDCGCTASYYAYVYPDQPYTIHVCKAFWSAPLTGTDSKGGTLVHEMSHFTVVAGTDDWAYGQAAASDLAASDPARALDNADSHEYFGENNPYQAARVR